MSTFLELQDEVIARRFNTALRTSIKMWLNNRYNRIWNLADWTFKHTSSAITVTAGDNSPAMPADFAKAEALYDQFGDPLPYVSPRRWEEAYVYATSGVAEAYTVINRQIFLGPKVVAAATLTLPYIRRLCHVDAGTGVTPGIMVADTDQPIWPAEHDYLLVTDTIILGMQLEKDNGWRDLIPERDELVRAMRDDLVRDEAVAKIWGAG